MLSILPEINVAMVEDVGPDIQVVEALGRKDHAHIITRIKEGDGLQVEIDVGDLRSTEPSLDLGRPETQGMKSWHITSSCCYTIL